MNKLLRFEKDIPQLKKICKDWLSITDTANNLFDHLDNLPNFISICVHHESSGQDGNLIMTLDVNNDTTHFGVLLEDDTELNILSVPSNSYCKFTHIKDNTFSLDVVTPSGATTHIIVKVFLSTLSPFM